MIAISCTSKSETSYKSDMIATLYKDSVKRFRELGVTGYLSYHHKQFFHYLEGPENAIEEALEFITANSVQSDIHTLQLGPILTRRFAQWDVLNSSDSRLPDIRIQDLIQDVMNSANKEGFEDDESKRIIIDMLDQMSVQRKRFVSIKSGSSISSDHLVSINPPFVVVLGASAGGLAPLQSIVRSLKPAKDVAFIIIQHIAPDAETMMDSILQRDTSMTVCAAKTDRKIEPGFIYVIPPGQNLEIRSRRFFLSGQQRAGQGAQFPIDICFRSVAREFGDKAIAVILSGTGSDGSRGAKVIKEAGGVVLAQSTGSSEFNDMPQTTIDTGTVHQVLAPNDIAEFLNNLNADFLQGSLALKPVKRSEYVEQVVALLVHDDIDFTQYKSETLFRRIERRRLLANIDTEELYMERLRHDEQEVSELREDILITVTSFFRDPEAWEVLEEAILQIISRDLNDGDTFRVWVTACASGEEVYTLGIILTELLERQDKDINFKIYATDIERKALSKASQGIYNERKLENLSDERLDRFFTKKADGYIINRQIRENIIFAPHNFIKNAPFTRMHLVTCRNVLIYMQPELQQIAIKMLHFALHVNGILFLGPSETLGKLQSEFYPVHRGWNQFKKLRNLRLPLHLSAEKLRSTAKELSVNTSVSQSSQGTPDGSLLELSLDTLVKRNGNTNILVNASRSVLMVISDPHGILQPPTGEPTTDVVAMVPEELRASLTFALTRAFKEGTDASHRKISCTPKGQSEKLVDIEVQPHTPPKGKPTIYALITLSESLWEKSNSVAESTVYKTEVTELREELDQTKQALQSAITDLETLDDEQRSINEQLSAANEELQSTNEELQSVNEELYTVNFEYQSKIHELSELNHDLDNLLDSTNLGVIFLDSELCIRRFTEVSTQTINLIPSDIGRPFLDLAHNLEYKDLINDMRRVLSIGKSINREISTNDKSKLDVGIHPYRAGTGLAKGVLLMFRETYADTPTSNQQTKLLVDAAD